MSNQAYHLVSAAPERHRGGNQAFQGCHLYPQWMVGIKSESSVKLCTQFGPQESLVLRVFDMQHTESMAIVEDVIFQISYSDSLVSHFHKGTLSNRDCPPRPPLLILSSMNNSSATVKECYIFAYFGQTHKPNQLCQIVLGRT